MNLKSIALPLGHNMFYADRYRLEPDGTDISIICGDCWAANDDGSLDLEWTVEAMMCIDEPEDGTYLFLAFTMWAAAHEKTKHTGPNAIPEPVEWTGGHDAE